MRQGTSILWAGTAIAMALLASPAAAQSQPATPPDPSVEAQESPADAGAAQTDDAVQTAAGADQATPGEETIVVTGIRRSLQSAQNIRRNSDQIIDAVVAEDIGKLPDLNTAQTAARIPGVQVYRQAGEAQNVLVRGLPNFTTTYNGREIFTAETRVVALQDFPSSNIAALEVFKTSTANLVEPGLAGLINVRSRQPFDFKEGQIAGSVWALHTKQGSDTSFNINLLATHRWEVGDGGDLGILLNVSRTEMTYLDAEISNTDFIADPTINGQRVRFPDIQRLFYRSGNRVRPSANAAIQYSPSEGIEFYAEGLWQGFRNKIDDRRLDALYFRSTAVRDLEFRDGTNLLRSGTFDLGPNGLFTFQGGTFNKTDTYQFAGGTRIKRGPWKLNLDIARTKSTFKGSTESLDRLSIGPSTVAMDLDRPEFTITNFALNDPAAYRFDGLFEQNQKSTGDDWQVRGDAEYAFEDSLLRNVQFGVRYTTRDAKRFLNEQFRGAPANTNAASLPLDFEVFNGVNIPGTDEFSAPTYNSIRDNIEAIRLLVGFPASGLPDRLRYTADEKSLAAYAQLTLGTDDLEGIVGARLTRVKSTVAGPVPTGIAVLDDAATAKETALLPNASIRARVNESLQLRAALSKTRTLPSFGDRAPDLAFGNPPPGGIGTPSTPFGARGGNPLLQPFTSWNFDAAAEYYFAPTGFVSVTGFHRRLKGFIQRETIRVTDPVRGVVDIDSPINTGRGRISGVEVQAQAFADFESLPDWARGFGMQANVTYLHARTEQDSSNARGLQLEYQEITDQLDGVSKWNYNLVGIYERYGFSARLTYNGRSSFRATQQLRGDDIYTERAHPAGRLDLSLNYEVTPQLTVFGDWTNITRKTFRQDFTSARNGAPEAEYVRYRRYDETTLSAGVRFKFNTGRAKTVEATPYVAPPLPPVVEPAPVIEQPAPPPVAEPERG